MRWASMYSAGGKPPASPAEEFVAHSPGDSRAKSAPATPHDGQCLLWKGMKRLLSVLLCGVVCLFAVAGCAASGQEEITASSHRTQTSPTENTEASIPSASTGMSVPSDSGEETEEGEESVVSRLFITVNESKAEIILENNISVSALVERLRAGDITYTADDYGGFEKVGALGFSLPRDDAHIQTRPGDVILYQGNQIVLFYGENSWSYTRLGRIEGLSDAQLRAFLHAGEGEIQVTLSLDG